ncbi:acetyl-CoA carboxylase biotin carboxylase subunit [Bryobacterales bacterium F-183]|nr:acetyl-CoA carboxylase biotin carboxylase subunit [Bryobacterales bacterium F-183]
MFRKVLVANRGEIAVRVMRALRERGIPSVAVYSDVDRNSLHVRMADEAVAIGPAPSSESYLNSAKILEAAARTGADAIHPGYGFLSENADFAQACADAGITFIGPSASAIQAMGSKTAARKIAEAAGAPVVPGTSEALADAEQAKEIAAQIGYPVMLKAAAGGGGKGMRLVHTEAELAGALRDASSEAERSFKNSEVYIEKAILRPRHVEIQVLGDQHGHMIHLGERECSVQRRHQKVIEECPSPLVTSIPGMRDRMGAAAVLVAKAAGYYNAGTVEFLADDTGAFYFLEMNTRLQVEHPVTELVTSTDLVHWQLRIAAGEPLTIQQQDVRWNGWSMECRLYAEDPDANFLPSPGKIQQLSMPSGPGIRLDSGVYPGWTVPMEYDPLLAKLATWAETRELAIDRMIRALHETSVAGIKTNIAFFDALLRDKPFRDGALHTGFIAEFLERTKAAENTEEMSELAAAVAWLHAKTKQPQALPTAETKSKWLEQGRARLHRS